MARLRFKNIIIRDGEEVDPLQGIEEAAQKLYALLIEYLDANGYDGDAGLAFQQVRPVIDLFCEVED